MCRFGWIQWPAIQMFFIVRIFVFFMTIFLKQMRITLSASKPHYHCRFSKPVFKIESIYEENIFGKQLPQAICSWYVFRLLHAPKFQIFYTKLNLMVKVVKLFTGVLQAKERLLQKCFPVSFTKYFRTLFLQNTSGSLLLLNTLFCSLRRSQPQNMCAPNLVISETNTVNCLRTVPCRSPNKQ